MSVCTAVIKRPIPCYVLTFFDSDSLKRTLGSLAQLGDQLAVHVIENHSDMSNTTFIAVRQTALQDCSIESWIEYETNISNNAILDVLVRGYGGWRNSDYVVLTDGDLEADPHWLDESLTILSRNPDVFACGVDLSLSNLPLKTFPESRHWVPAPIATQKTYVEGLTGVHLLTMRAADLDAFLNYRQCYAVPFVDSAMHDYCYRVRGMRWARTKKYTARHLTWDHYADVGSLYTQLKLGLLARGDCWDHQRVAGAHVHTGCGTTQWRANEALFALSLSAKLRRWMRLTRAGLMRWSLGSRLVGLCA